MARIPLAIHATDDFGLAALGLEIERTQVRDEKSQVETARVDLSSEPPPPDAPPRIDVSLDHELELKERQLGPGNLLKLRSTASAAR